MQSTHRACSRPAEQELCTDRRTARHMQQLAAGTIWRSKASSVVRREVQTWSPALSAQTGHGTCSTPAHLENFAHCWLAINEDYELLLQRGVLLRRGRDTQHARARSHACHR